MVVKVGEVRSGARGADGSKKVDWGQEGKTYHKRVIVLNAVFLEQTECMLRCSPGWSYVALGVVSSKLLIPATAAQVSTVTTSHLRQHIHHIHHSVTVPILPEIINLHLNTPHQHISLLLLAQLTRRLMHIPIRRLRISLEKKIRQKKIEKRTLRFFSFSPMQPNLVPSIPDRFHLLRERLQRMRRDVECALNVVFLKQRKQAVKADISAEKTTRDCGRVGGLVGFGDEPGSAAVDLLMMSRGMMRE